MVVTGIHSFLEQCFEDFKIRRTKHKFKFLINNKINYQGNIRIVENIIIYKEVDE